MTGPDAPTAPEGSGYLRGASAAGDVPRAIAGAGYLCAIGLVVLAVVLFAQARHENARSAQLHHRGVTVTVTVTSCVGIVSGTGITESSFQCTGTFELAGDHYNQVIRGSSALLAQGSRVPAVVLPGDPGSLSAPGSATVADGSRFVASAITAGLGLSLAGVLAWRSRRRSKIKSTMIG